MRVAPIKAPAGTDKFCDVKASHLVTIDMVLGLLCSALEGGSNYWYMIERHKLPKGVSSGKDLECESGGGALNWKAPYSVAVTPGGEVIFSVIDGDTNGDGKKTYRLDRVALKQGLQLMAEKYPKHWYNFIDENGDAETGDVFLQLCLFGSVIYG